MREPFSNQLEQWLKSTHPKTIHSLTNVFAEKSFAILVLLLLLLPALPIPTGGITHVFELIVMLLAIEMVFGMQTIWLPKKWKSLPLGKLSQGKIIPMIVRRIRWLERFSRPRLGSIITNHFSLRFIGILFFILAFAAFVAPPFVGLDTLTSIGAVLIALSLILEDIVLFVAGCAIGAVGVGLVIGAGGLTLHFINRLIH